MKIYKYKLELIGSQSITMPVNAEILSIQYQSENLCLWAMFDDDELKTEARIFVIVGTWYQFDCEGLNFLATVQQDGVFVWHIFEEIAG